MLHDKSLYRVSTTKKGWRASREDCQKRKADLLVINSREELAFVSRLMDTSWVGLSDREKEGTHKWVDGTPMTSSWRHVKPRDDGGARDCVVAGEDGWSEEPCNRLHHWICEKVLDLDHLEAERNKEGSVMLTEEEEEAPSITEFHSSTHVLPVGQTARYTCHAGGTPEPTVEWLHNGRPLVRDSTDDQSEAWVERGFLFVRGGRYGVNTVCCMASNSAGTANHSAELLVFDACDLTLDPNTAHRGLSLSEDNRKVTWVGEDQSYPDHPDRFDSWEQVLGREALTGRCYWEVEREGWVGIGVTYRGITRRGREPLIHGSRLDVCSVTPGLLTTLYRSKTVSLQQLVEAAGPGLTGAGALGSLLGIRSVRVAQKLLELWRQKLCGTERSLLMKYSRGEALPDPTDPFPDIILSPALGEETGPLLAVSSPGKLSLHRADKATLYENIVKAIHKKGLSGRPPTS
ncbi:uncharacterized protein LOC130387931 [Gadus chalcogrammus]|uniref:uncharacterized protein LOC130387931 n=1 Tax=Gadus chalcogrammus TaxID=1042646 RepID=UPI0024C4AC5B|nr:uncharacterized protein LOC130387931 [Gadus chalcogrammus]